MGAQSPDIFTERVSRLMKRNSLSKKDMASRLNVDYSTFWRKLNGKRNIDLPVLIQIATILGTSVSYLVGETDNPVLPHATHSESLSEQSTTDEASKGSLHKGRLGQTNGYAYWGGVLDEAQRVAAGRNLKEISLIVPLLKLAYETLATAQEREQGKAGSILPSVSAYNGDHSIYRDNSLTVEPA